MAAAVKEGAALPRGATLLAQGAEARVYKATFLGQDAVVKERFAKAYRHPVLDAKLTRSRLVQEARCLFRCRAVGIDVPALLFLDEQGARIYMEFVHGCSLRDYIFAKSEPEKMAMVAKAGAMVARLHNQEFVHGDLTTSNMMVRASSQSLVLIDFGLATTQAMEEDKAVDLYVLERAFSSTHPRSEPLFAAFLEAYYGAVRGAAAIRRRFADVRARGRKKLAFG